MSTKSYSQIFEQLTDGHTPHPWQARLGNNPVCDNRLIRIPTGLGKTDGVLGAWLYHRVMQQDMNWPTRLVWCLPMRVLADQTALEATKLIANLKLDDVDVHLLMGGVDADHWHLHPEKPAIIIGTQDMLLSRALNRGYAASRARWPMDYGLLNHDSLWVMDEVQLMDVGLATSVQLQSFRRQFAQQAMRPCYTWWMSATLQHKWLQTVDSTSWIKPLNDDGQKVRVPTEEQCGALWKIRKPVHIQNLAMKDDKNAQQLANVIWQAHQDVLPQPDTGHVTLAIVNRVETACNLYKNLNKLLTKVTNKPETRLIHSRFRGMEREAWANDFLNKAHCKNSSTNMILIATQVVEAGVDISATSLITELAPWPSLVQRFGRAARYSGIAHITVVDRQLSDKAALPYSVEELDAAGKALAQLNDVGIASLEQFEAALDPQQLEELYPYAPMHLLTARENDELFDTTADLNGADLDISRFIRSGDERDVSVCWIDPPEDKKKPPSDQFTPQRHALCPVPVGKAKDWLFKKSSCRSWVWNYVDARWQKAKANDCYPGQLLLVDRQSGGYDSTTGFDARCQTRVNPIDDMTGKIQQADQADRAQSRDDQSQMIGTQLHDWRSIATHGKEVAADLVQIAQSMALPNTLVTLLDLAGRVHDWGKSHIAFQNSIKRNEHQPQQRDLAKAPQNAWCRSNEMYSMDQGDKEPKRCGFRHELASTLALFELLRRHNLYHPALLGPYQQLIEQGVLALPDANDAPVNDCPMANELNALDAKHFNLLTYLVCAHHGKVRSSWQSTPQDQKFYKPDAIAFNKKPILGILEDDTLPSIRLVSAEGSVFEVPAIKLSTDLAAIGLSARYGESWIDRVQQLKQAMGPFTLAYLESLLRAADIRVSKQSSETPDTLINIQGAQA